MKTSKVNSEEEHFPTAKEIAKIKLVEFDEKYSYELSLTELKYKLDMAASSGNKRTSFRCEDVGLPDGIDTFNDLKFRLDNFDKIYKVYLMVIKLLKDKGFVCIPIDSNSLLPVTIRTGVIICW
jgi:hypothetical protein